MPFNSLSKRRKIILGVLAGIALLCLAAMIGFLLARHKYQSPPVSPGAQVEIPVDAAQQKVFSLSVFSTPKVSEPAPVITFRPDSSNPMPENDSVLSLGESLRIGGTVYANRPLSAVTVSISCSHNSQKPYPYRKTIRLTESEKGIYSFDDKETDSGKSLMELVDFSELLVGVHTLKVVASCDGIKSEELFRCRFYVVGPEWQTISEELFPDSYPEALQFFGDTRRFLYRYQVVYGRYTLADPEWEKEFITTITAYPNGEPWLVHVDAKPYFEKAFQYLETSYLRVHGTNGDTGLKKASDLITEYNGCYVSRMTSSLKAISHHSFGTAVDVNASMEPNKNSLINKSVIDDDVKNHLSFNGLKKADGLTYYDFFYDGSYDCDPNHVPQTCVNYLLYELGFFRAGFGWAHYYKSTSDGMHFCLSEFVTYSHDDQEFGLRKVFVYAAPMEWKGSLPEPPFEPMEPTAVSETMSFTPEAGVDPTPAP